jgi:small subunit ribosomal protein S6
MTQLYEGMFLLDNQAVRADWNAAKAVVTSLLAKHGGRVQTARRWDERRLAYSIRGRKRGTYLLAYFEQDGAGSQSLRRDLDIEERLLRYLILAVEALPEGELEASKAELEAGFSVPPPPPDDEPAHEEPAPEPEPVVEEEVALVGEGADAAQEGKD